MLIFWLQNYILFPILQNYPPDLLININFFFDFPYNTLQFCYYRGFIEVLLVLDKGGKFLLIDILLFFLLFRS